MVKRKRKFGKHYYTLWDDDIHSRRVADTEARRLRGRGYLVRVIEVSPARYAPYFELWTYKRRKK